jgi:hypothetical protein
MAHFARLDSNNIVVQILAIDNNKIIENGQESEDKGIEFCKQLFDKDYPNVTYKQCSINKSFRFNYPSIGDRYDPQVDAFRKQPYFSSWIEDSNYQWVPPIPKPNNDKATWEFTDYQTGTGYWVDQDTNQPL